jgi:hypothetical protein
MKGDALRWPPVIGLSAFALDLFAFGGAGGPVRFLLAAWFLIVCTGMSFVPLLRIPSSSTELLIGVLTSLAMDTVVVTAIVLIGGLSVITGLLLLQGICMIGCGLQLLSFSGQLGWRQ